MRRSRSNCGRPASQGWLPSAWSRLRRAYPASADIVRAVAASLKRAGYKSARNYLSEYQAENARRGHRAPVGVAMAFRDARRAVSRDTGPTLRSRAARPEDIVRMSKGPLRDTLLVGRWWLLREYELWAL